MRVFSKAATLYPKRIYAVDDALSFASRIQLDSQLDPDQFWLHTQNQYVPLNCNLAPPGSIHLGGCIDAIRSASASSFVFSASMCANKPTVDDPQYTSPSMRTFSVFNTISDPSPELSK